MKYAVVLERGKNSWGAYSPDVPGCASVGKTRKETIEMYREALRMHLKGLKEDGLPVPKPVCRVETVEVEG